MNRIDEIQEEVVEEFSFFDDWMDKYEHIIAQAKELEPMDEKDKNPENRINGCQSQVWLTSEIREGNLFFKADSDALITKGLIALLVRVLSGHQPADIAKTDLYFIEKIGLREHLSPNRSNGLVAMVKKMKLYGLAYATKKN